MLQNNVEKLLMEAKMTRYTLAKKCGFVSPSSKVVLYTTVDNAISNKKITIESALKIVQVLKDAHVCETFEDVFFLDGE